MQKFDVRLPNEFVLMARGLSMVENTGLRLDPDIDVVALLKPFARKLMVQRYNPLKMASNAKNSFFAFEHVLRALPSLISKTIYKVEEGEVTVNIEVKHISEIANQLSLAIIIAALLIGSSLVMLIDVGPRFYEMPVLGFVGFTISLALGVFTVLRYFIDF
jgi:ubiquinone biosynthesis protein